VCTPELDVIFRLSPEDVDTAKVCEASTNPLSDVNPPPAPASDPQENVPVVVL
jgi:hypothetical protein